MQCVYRELTDVPADVDVAGHIRSKSDRTDLTGVGFTETGETTEGETDEETGHEEHFFVVGEEEEEDDRDADGIVDHEGPSVTVSVVQPRSPVYAEDGSDRGCLRDSGLRQVSDALEA